MLTNVNIFNAAKSVTLSKMSRLLRDLNIHSHILKLFMMGKTGRMTMRLISKFFSFMVSYYRDVSYGIAMREFGVLVQPEQKTDCLKQDV